MNDFDNSLKYEVSIKIRPYSSEISIYLESLLVLNSLKSDYIEIEILTI